MKNNPIKKISAIAVLLIGILNLVTWTILILSGKVTDYNETPVSYLFHWISEFSTALLLIISGFAIIKRHPLHHNLLSLSLGFLVMAIGGAFAYYLMNFELPIFIFTTLITGFTIILIIINYQKLQDFILLTLGLSIYSLLNLMGKAFQTNDISSLILEIPAFLFLVILIAGIMRKQMTFRFITHTE